MTRALAPGAPRVRPSLVQPLLRVPHGYGSCSLRSPRRCSHAKSSATKLRAEATAQGTEPRTSGNNHTNSARYVNVPPLADQTREIRAHLMKDHLPGGLIYIEGGEPALRNGGDVYYRFRAHSSFVYLTGVHEPGFSCLLDCDKGTFTLLSPKQPPEAAFWLGGLPSLADMARQYGADSCCYTEDLPSLLAAAARKGTHVHVLPDQLAKLNQVVANLELPPRPLGGGSAAAGVRVTDSFLEGTIKRCRGHKTAAEVSCILHANQVSGRAHMAMWSACTPGQHEYSLEAAFTHSAMLEGLVHLGYPCIVGSGTNSAILHYDSNRRRVEDGDLVLVDAGVEFRHYTADISRTFPVNGAFTPVQRDIYDAVLRMQERALSLMGPGVAFGDVDKASRLLMLQLLRDIGLVKGSIDGLVQNKIDRIFMPHGLGHHLGLDVHDISSTGQVPEQLRPGHVVTCEPGIYFISSLMESALANTAKSEFLNADMMQKLAGFGGVRIEDNVLIEKDGSFNITMAAGVPKTADAMAEVMRQAADGRASLKARA